MFFFIRRLGLSIYCLPQNILDPKNICNFSYPKKYSHPAHTLILRKKPKVYRMTPKTSPVFVIYPQNLHTPKIIIFLKALKNIEIQDFELQKNNLSLRTCIYTKIHVSEYPPTHIHIPFASGCEKRTLQKQDEETDTNYNLSI